MTDYEIQLNMNMIQSIPSNDLEEYKKNQEKMYPNDMHIMEDKLCYYHTLKFITSTEINDWQSGFTTNLYVLQYFISKFINAKTQEAYMDTLKNSENECKIYMRGNVISLNNSDGLYCDSNNLLKTYEECLKYMEDIYNSFKNWYSLNDDECKISGHLTHKNDLSLKKPKHSYTDVNDVFYNNRDSADGGIILHNIIDFMFNDCIGLIKHQIEFIENYMISINQQSKLRSIVHIIYKNFRYTSEDGVKNRIIDINLCGILDVYFSKYGIEYSPTSDIYVMLYRQNNSKQYFYFKEGIN